MPKRIFVAGHKGMAGSAICRQLAKQSGVELVTIERQQLDLIDQAAVYDFFAESRIDQVYLAAAKVGGVHANHTYPADFIFQNLAVQNNVVHATYQNGIERLLFLGSSCIYPKHAEQPMQEAALLTGVLESTNEPYAVAKIAGIKLCESYNRQYGTDFRSVMPTNLYGINDNFHPENSHVIPALMRRFHESKVANANKVVVWGTGNACREFLCVDDMATACVFLMGLERECFWRIVDPRLSHLNIGTGKDVTIRELAQTMARVVGFTGALEFDASKPDGAMRKLLDVTAMSDLGWRYQIDLERGLSETYQWFVEHFSAIRS